MLSIVAALVLAPLIQGDRIVIHTRVFSLSQTARVDIDGSTVEKKQVGTYIVGLELAVDGAVDELVKKKQATLANFQNVPTPIGAKISKDFYKRSGTQTISILPEGGSTTGSLGSSYGLDVSWRFGNNDRIYGDKGISHHFDVHKGEAGLVVLMEDGERWMLEITVSKD